MTLSQAEIDERNRISTALIELLTKSTSGNRETATYCVNALLHHQPGRTLLVDAAYAFGDWDAHAHNACRSTAEPQP